MTVSTYTCAIKFVLTRLEEIGIRFLFQIWHPKYTFPPLVGGTLNHGKLQWKSLRWRLGKSIRRKLLWPKNLPLSWHTNSSSFLRSSGQVRLKIPLLYFRILQWPRTPVLQLVDLRISIPLQNKILHKQAVLQRFFICLCLFPVCWSFLPPVIIYSVIVYLSSQKTQQMCLLGVTYTPFLRWL